MKAINRIPVIFMCTILLMAAVGCTSTATREGTGGYIDDSVITTNVKGLLLKTSGIDSNQITVETFKGAVKLSGFLDTQAMIDLAVATAKTATGVLSVTNDLTVKGQQGQQ
ncbi:MAG: BON domain-containing protein [Gammaproteobacteria bacterium]|jgi:osmotically-inducible protein OsmY|nr:BON domain-containing protein [Gammaproteobacteria bacterium]